MNLANKITVVRIVLAIIFMPLIYLRGLGPKLAAFLVFVAAALTDYYDGLIARKMNLISDLGKLLDPIADKILVLAAFVMFVQMRLVEAWMVVLIMSREILITTLRGFAMSKGRILAANKAGKHKTASQMSAIFIILGVVIIKEFGMEFDFWGPAWETWTQLTIYVSVLIAISLTLISGISYLWENRSLFNLK